MTDTPYKRLAARLDELPQRVPCRGRMAASCACSPNCSPRRKPISPRTCG